MGWRQSCQFMKQKTESFMKILAKKKEIGTLGNVIFQSLKFNYWQRAMKYAQNL